MMVVILLPTIIMSFVSLVSFTHLRKGWVRKVQQMVLNEPIRLGGGSTEQRSWPSPHLERRECRISGLGDSWERKSKLLVSFLINPIIHPYLIPYMPHFKEFRL